MTQTCTHSDTDVGVCPHCGACAHDLVLNGACFYCGEDELELNIKPRSTASTDSFVPFESVRRKN